MSEGPLHYTIHSTMNSKQLYLKSTHEHSNRKAISSDQRAIQLQTHSTKQFGRTVCFHNAHMYTL